MNLSNLEYVERDGVRYDVVEVRDYDHKKWERRILIKNNMCVSNDDSSSEEKFVDGYCSFDVTSWKQVRPLPKKHYVPFTVEDAHLFRDRWISTVKDDTCQNYRKIVEYNCANIWLKDSTRLSYEEALKTVFFDDGTPFGKEVKG